MGRNAQPLTVLEKTGKKHLTKKEKELRKVAEEKTKLGSNKIICPESILIDQVALKKWNAIIKEYDDARQNGHDLLKSSDVGILERYCLNYSIWLADITKLKTAKRLKAENKKQLRISIMQYQKDMRADEDRLLLNVLAKIKNVPQVEPRKPNNPMEDDFGI